LEFYSCMCQEPKIPASATEGEDESHEDKGSPKLQEPEVIPNKR
jgi:hypothetical protein